MDVGLILLVVVVATALTFDFTNGFHDTANAMATTIATGALPPRVAVAVAGVLNFAGAFISLEVTLTIAEDIVWPADITLGVVFAGLAGAILWNLTTWYFALPSSSSHALIGGIVGTALVSGGFGAVNGTGILTAVLVPAIAAPLIAAAVAAGVTYLAYRVVRGTEEGKARRGYRWGQVASGSLVALAHGTYDPQKTMGVIVLALVSYVALPGSGFEVPLWVIVSAATAIALGTYFGDWRIIRTMGRRVTDIDTPQDFSAETSSSAVILASSSLGLPLSATHVVSGGIAGAGFGRYRRPDSIRWAVARNIVLAWLLTLPGAAVVAGLASAAVISPGENLIGASVVGALLVAGAAGLWWAARRSPVTPENVTET